MHTRIKFCGLTRAEDVRLAVELGADYIGLVFAPRSPRRLLLGQARMLRDLVPEEIGVVALVMDNPRTEIEQIVESLQPDLLQFHGGEDDAFAGSFHRPFWKAIAMGGQDGAVNRVEVIRGDTVWVPPHLSKAQDIALEPGDRVRVRTPGGGGYGPPALRAPAAISAPAMARASVQPTVRASRSMSRRRSPISASSTRSDSAACRARWAGSRRMPRMARGALSRFWRMGRRRSGSVAWSRRREGLRISWSVGRIGCPPPP